MLRLIPRYPAKISGSDLTAKLIGEGFKISKRSVERDLDLLSRGFALACDDRERPYGWSWQKDAQPLHVPGLQVHEALVFKLVEAHLAHLLPATLREPLAPYLKLADQRIRESNPNRGPASWPAKVRVVPPTQPLLAPKVSDAAFRAITQALLDGVQLTAHYLPRGGAKSTEYRLNPLGLVQRGPVTYLVATAWDYEDPRTFSVHRFTAAEPLEQPAQSIAGFDLDAYIANGALGFRHSNENILLTARFIAPAADHLRETPLTKDQVLEVDGSFTVLKASVPNTGQLRWWLLGFGEQVEVLGPPEIRSEMAATAKAMAARYRGP
jgi:predicted DNA-binding transcriptional regulator YafY